MPSGPRKPSPCPGRGSAYLRRDGDLLDELAPEREAESRARGRAHVSVHQLEGLLGEVVQERVVAARELDGGGARRGDAQVKPGGEEDGSAPEVRRHRQLVGGGEGGDAERL